MKEFLLTEMIWIGLSESHVKCVVSLRVISTTSGHKLAFSGNILKATSEAIYLVLGNVSWVRLTFRTPV